ncbi:MAG: hypothetical protein D6724_08085 [Armatimonadetes bacterium]|nr:MAG: hypothetical protein D6724_08085 [Armatimonadota bacterium]
MKSALILALCLLCASLPTATQTTSKPDPYGVDPILDTLAEIDLANQILPLLLTKEQTNEILTIIERTRAAVKEQQKKEADALKALKAEADKVHKEAVEMGKVPSQEFLKKVNDLFATWEKERLNIRAKNTILLMSRIKDILNEGQIKAAIGVVDKVYDEQLKQFVENPTDDQKLSYYAVNVFFNDSAYEFLRKRYAAMK